MSEWSKEPSSSLGGVSRAGSNPAACKNSLTIASVPEWSKGEDLRSSGDFASRVRTPSDAHRSRSAMVSTSALHAGNPSSILGGTTYRFRSVNGSTLDFDSNIPGSSPGET
jgi:hypothetical protein